MKCNSELAKIIGLILGIVLVWGLLYGHDYFTTFTDQEVNVDEWILRGDYRTIRFNLNVPHTGYRKAECISLTISAFDVDSEERHRIYLENDFLGLLDSRGCSNQRTVYTRFVIPYYDLDKIHSFLCRHSGRINVHIKACSETNTDGNVFIQKARFVVDY